MTTAPAPGRSSQPARPITDDEIAAFWADGVVCLRGVLPLDEVEAMTEPVERALDGEETADMSALGDALEAAGANVLVDPERPANRGFRSGVDHWRTRPEFFRFAARSALPSIVATLLHATEVRLYEDSVLAKEPGAVHRTAWHQDLSYFNVDGDQLVTTWVPLDVTTVDSGAMTFVRGSHRWDEVFQPNLFVSDLVIPGTAGSPVPDIDAPRPDGSAYDVISFDLGPGDLTVHHARTLHAAGSNASTRRRRAISIRYCGDDARFLRRRGTVRKDYQHTLVDGDELPDADAPVVWRAAAQP